jgi:hypothetical protein
MAEELDEIDWILKDLVIDPKKSEERLRQLSDDFPGMPEENPPSLGSTEYLDFLLSTASKRDLLDSKKGKKSARELALWQFNVDYLNEQFVGLLCCLKHIRDLSIRKIAINRVISMYGKAFMGIGKISEQKGNAHRFILSKQAEAARKSRAANPREVALIAAIKAERGTTPILRPNKEADAILDGVNRRLEAAGFEQVKVDVVRRRLEKRLALLKSAEKPAE